MECKRILMTWNVRELGEAFDPKMAKKSKEEMEFLFEIIPLVKDW